MVLVDDVARTIQPLRSHLRRMFHGNFYTGSDNKHSFTLKHLRHYFLLVVYAKMGTTMIGEACVGSAECEAAGVY